MTRALLVCPGRGSYTRESLGSLANRSTDAQAVVDACDTWRTARGVPTVTELDASSAFSSRRHLAGEHASLLTFAATLADVADLTARYELVGVTGNSMGWYTALAAAGSLPLTDAIRLVDTMGAWQQDNVIGGQLLVPVTGEDFQRDPAREAACDAAIDAARAAGHHAWWSIRLGAYAVLAGDEPGLDALTRALPAETRGGRTFPLRLPAHSAFHTPLMAGTSARARRELSDLTFGPPRVPLIDGRGRIHRPRHADPADLADWTLGAQVTDTYDFTTALHAALHHTAPDVVLLPGPGNSLGGPTAAVVIQTGWFGVRSREALSAAGVLVSPGR